MEKLLGTGARIIVLNGFEFEKIVRDFAPLHPECYFIINDVAVDDLANVYSSVFKTQEVSLLAGVLAARVTKSKQIGFIGGKDAPAIRDFFQGFRKGISLVDEAITPISEYLAEGDDFASGFDNRALGFIKANNLYNQGVDIIFSAAGASGNGVIRAAVKNKKYVIGIDANQDYIAQGTVLTSVMKRIDTATYEAVTQALEGTFVPGVHFYGLREKGVSLSPMTYTSHLVSEAVLEELEMLKAKIIEGAL